MEAITKKYGPVSSVRLGSELLVIIGTVKPAVALLEGRSGIYCDWPRLEMAGNVISGGLQTICLGYNDRWRRFRSYEPIQEPASRQLILDVLENPTLYREALTRYAADVIMKVTYGKVSPTCHDDKEVIMDKSRKKKWQAEELELFSSQVENVRRSLDSSGTRDNCFASYMLERQTEVRIEVLVLKSDGLMVPRVPRPDGGTMPSTASGSK
ncbi:hypothetical protein PPACK8108_LOCUS6451 [Phakopsora pachyrhizi]|uniref:Cytochrome P450 n=1 Tax=Phakopsora pachyrhizi TaxID=170000 RepID=A0AAV0AUB6_PHAPC|nr:hypothetical protein PPACK8108_LOCUS6451 [Phakopsora pachyrhizi]